MPPFGDAKYNTMIAINQRLMVSTSQRTWIGLKSNVCIWQVGDVDETQWGTKLLTPVCEERSHELEKEVRNAAAFCYQDVRLKYSIK